MRLVGCCPVQRGTLLEPDWNVVLTAEIHDFLNSRPTCALCDKHLIQRPSRFERLANGVNADEQIHELDGTANFLIPLDLFPRVYRQEAS